MTSTSEGETSLNYEQFRDVLSAVLIERLTDTSAGPRRKDKLAAKKAAAEARAASTPETDAEELSDFIEYIASELYACLPADLQTLDHRIWAESASLQERYPLPLTGQDIAALLPALDPSAADSLQAYGVIDEATFGIHELLAPVITAYITTASTPPPPPSSTRGKVTACEICGRDWINLSYHHLIPRFVHAKVVKRGWHRPDELQNVAWLCGACHRFVHHFAKHEDLARHYYTVDLLLEQDEIIAWAKWVGRLRWKKR
ncbi:YisB protein [Thozetella sp. PMI_491]|nr:YisB protein [Thozetella sp. PMI_491]